MKTLNELSKQTLGSYVKKAAKDARINSMIGKDFEHKAKTSRKPGMKDAASSLSIQYKSKAWKRDDNIAKAVGRLVKENDVPKKNQDVADKSYLKTIGKKPTIKSDLKNLKNFLTGKKETMEEVEIAEAKATMCGRCGTKHVPPKFGGTCPALKENDMMNGKDPREYDYEGDMAKSQLRSIIANAQSVHDMLDDNTNMAEWVQSKITLAADYITTVKDYITSETNEETKMEPIHPSALHVKPVKVNGQTKYKVHAVGKKFASGIKVGEHLSDTELDDFSEMGGKIKHMKESTLSDILEMARGRPRKNPAPVKPASSDEEDDYGPDKGPEADQNIHMQLKRAHDAKDLKGGADVKFENGQKHFIKSEHAHKVLSALEKLKPADRAEASSHIYKSHDNFKAVHSMLK